MSATKPEAERMGTFLTGAMLDVEAAALGTHEEWAATARAYLAGAVSSAGGFRTVRVSVAALTVLLSLLDEQAGGARG